MSWRQDAAVNPWSVARPHSLTRMSLSWHEIDSSRVAQWGARLLDRIQ
jgi:hypothetical protein